MKENNGKAAKRRFLRQLMLCGGGVFIICIVGAFLWAEDGLFSSSSSEIRGTDHRHLLRSTTSSEHGRSKLPPTRDRRRRRQQQRRDGEQQQFDEAEMIDKILEAEVHLVSLSVRGDELERSHPSSYAGIYAHFCELDFDAHKRDPAAVPMFRDLVSKSEDCSDYPGGNFKIDLKKIADLARHRDVVASENGEAVPKVLNLTTVAFHESRCGSTLVANALLAMDPSKHRTYTESQPGSQALRQICGEEAASGRCTADQAAAILRDTVYLMSRSDDPQEERVFFKFQSITTKNIDIFKKAFPKVPWLFIYRDPVQVMMSHITDDPTLKRAKCVATQFHNTPKDIKNIAKRHGRIAKEMAPEEYCAAHLAAITEGAVRELNDYAVPLNYDGLIENLHEQVLPRIWGRALTDTEIDNILRVSQTYSKGRGDRHKDFHGDSDQKEAAASDKVKEAATLILEPSYVELTIFESKLMERELPVPAAPAGLADYD